MQKFSDSYRSEPGGTRVADVDEGAHLRLTVVLKPDQPVVPEHHFHGSSMSHAEYKVRHSTNARVIARLRAFAEAQGLHVDSALPETNQVILSGTIRQARAAFMPEQIGVYEAEGKRFMARTGHLSVPTDIADQIVAVMGFDQRPIARPHLRKRAAGSAHVQGQTSYTPTEVAQRYQFPAGANLTGQGEAIALIELGGGYRDAQMAAYFQAIGVNRTGKLSAISVDGATNSPSGANGADGEVQLDIEIAGAVAPGADIAVYFAPNQGSGFQDAIAAAIADQTVMASVVSISWGGPEDGYSVQDLNAMNQTLSKALALGITVCVASGDNGASDGEASGKHVDFPASSPYVLGCGGTSLPVVGPEVAWNNGRGQGASGGGYSTHFTRPSWQSGNARAGRGVPDLAADADPNTGYQVTVDGKQAVYGGTSAAAPLLAGLIALVNQSAGARAGFINPTLYATPTVLTDITHGNNNGFSAKIGWDPVTGLGSPLGDRVLAALRANTVKAQAAE